MPRSKHRSEDLWYNVQIQIEVNGGFMNISTIRAEARHIQRQLKGIYMLCLVPIIVEILSMMFSGYNISQTNIYAPDTNWGNSMFPYVLGLVLALFTSSIAFTLVEVLRRKREEVNFKDSLRFLNDRHTGKIILTLILKNVLLSLWTFFATVATFLILLVIGVFLGFFESAISVVVQNFYTYEGLILFAVLFIVCGLAIALPQYYAYSQVEFILFDKLEKGEYTTARAIIRESRQMMKGYKGSRFVLDLTFIGWIILTGITLGFAGIYVVPYRALSEAIFYEKLKERQAVLEDVGLN